MKTNSLGRDGRLPPERALAAEFGVTRAELRRALAELEAAGRLIRHVGRGTFLVGAARISGESWPARPDEPSASSPLASWTDETSPRQIYEAALALQPALAGLAAANGTPGRFRSIRDAGLQVSMADTWERYDAADAAFHRAIAEACRNPVLLALEDALAATRSALAWGALRERGEAPSSDHPTIADHAAIATAITARDQHAARETARHHVLVEAASILGPWI